MSNIIFIENLHKAKTQLIGRYEQTLGAKLFGGNRMFIDTKEALILITRYFKDFKL